MKKYLVNYTTMDGVLSMVPFHVTVEANSKEQAEENAVEAIMKRWTAFAKEAIHITQIRKHR